MNKKRKDNKIGTLILIIAVIVFTILGVISLRYNFKKFNRAAGYSERILNIYEKIFCDFLKILINLAFQFL